MEPSAELRWFWPDTVPTHVEKWFAGLEFAPGGGVLPPRRDVYLFAKGQPELGVKQRHGKPGLEIKGLVSSLGRMAHGRLVGEAQLWCKWSTSALTLDGAATIATPKVRLLRKFDTGAATPRQIQLNDKEQPLDPGAELPRDGCNVELTRVHLGDGGPLWWTLGFEAFGRAEAVERNLRRLLEHLAHDLPDLTGARELSYPAWLALAAS